MSRSFVVPAALAIGLVAGTACIVPTEPAVAQNPTLNNVIPGSTQVNLQAKITAIDTTNKNIAVDKTITGVISTSPMFSGVLLMSST